MIPMNIVIATVLLITVGHANADLQLKDQPKFCWIMEPENVKKPAQDLATFSNSYLVIFGNITEAGKVSQTLEIKATKPDISLSEVYITARDSCNGNMLRGVWKGARSEDQLLDCSGGLNNGLTLFYNVASGKGSPTRDVAVTWIPSPYSVIDSLTFWITVVDNGKGLHWVRRPQVMKPCVEKEVNI